MNAETTKNIFSALPLNFMDLIKRGAIGRLLCATNDRCTSWIFHDGDDSVRRTKSACILWEYLISIACATLLSGYLIFDSPFEERRALLDLNALKQGYSSALS